MRPSILESPISNAPGGAKTRGEAIIEAIRLGVPKEHAAKAAGISPRAFYSWQQRGLALLEREEIATTYEQLRGSDAA